MTLRMNITPADVRTATRKAINAGLEYLLGESNKDVPLDNADLMRSGRVEMEDDNSGRVVYDSPYAVIQHENLTFNHPNGRKAKYLENAAIDNRANIEKVIGRKFQAEIQ